MRGHTGAVAPLGLLARGPPRCIPEEIMASGTEKRQRERLLQIRLTHAEMARIVEAADRRGLAPSSHARDVLLGAPAPLRVVRRPPIARTELARLVALVGNLGSDIRHLNRSTAGQDPALIQLTHGVHEVRDLLMRALGRDA